jgi:hypothetical protein
MAKWGTQLFFCFVFTNISKLKLTDFCTPLLAPVSVTVLGDFRIQVKMSRLKPI